MLTGELGKAQFEDKSDDDVVADGGGDVDSESADSLSFDSAYGEVAVGDVTTSSGEVGMSRAFVSSLGRAWASELKFDECIPVMISEGRRGE